MTDPDDISKPKRRWMEDNIASIEQFEAEMPFLYASDSSAWDRWLRSKGIGHEEEEPEEEEEEVIQATAKETEAPVSLVRRVWNSFKSFFGL